MRYYYDRSLAIAYADKYWSHYNNFYYDYNAIGGDCTSFVSQILWDPTAANLPDEGPNWGYYGGTGTAASSTSWRWAPSQHQFFINNPRGSYYDFAHLGYRGSWAGASAWDKSHMLIGDIHYYDWTNNGGIDHVAFATAYLSDGSTLIDAHNPNHFHFRWDLGSSSRIYYMDQMHNTIYY